MAKHRKVFRKIRDSAAAYTRIAPEELAAALGAHAVGPAPKAVVRYPSLSALKRQLSAELVSEGGRPPYTQDDVISLGKRPENDERDA